MTTGQRKMGFSLYLLQAVGALGVLISLANHRTAGILIFGLLAGLSGVLINRIARQNPAVLRRSAFTTRIHVLFLWCVAVRRSKDVSFREVSRNFAAFRCISVISKKYFP